jgi:hypothetical protein
MTKQLGMYAELKQVTDFNFKQYGDLLAPPWARPMGEVV